MRIGIVWSSFIWVSYEKRSSPYCVMSYFWWGCRRNLKLITLGSERVRNLNDCSDKSQLTSVSKVLLLWLQQKRKKRLVFEKLYGVLTTRYEGLHGGPQWNVLSHRLPMNPGGQLHSNTLSPSPARHAAPFSHGLGEQGSPISAESVESFNNVSYRVILQLRYCPAISGHCVVHARPRSLARVELCHVILS